MKYCGNCRLQLDDHVQYCPRCRASQTYRQQAPVEQQPPQYQYPEQAQPQQGYYQQQPQQPQQPQAPPARPMGGHCPACGAALRLISEYSAYYCDRCMEYRSLPSRVEHEEQPPFEHAQEQQRERPEQKSPEHVIPPEEPEIKETGPLDFRTISVEQDEEQQAKKISAALNRTKIFILETEKTGIDVTELYELYHQCGNVYATDDFYTAIHYLERIQDIIEKMSVETGPDVHSSGTTDAGDGTVSELEHNPPVIDNGVVVIDEPTDSHDRWELDDKPIMSDKEKAIHALESAKTAIIDAEEDGYDTQTAKKLFKDARPLYEVEEFKAVVDKVREVEREILRIKGHSEHEIKEILGETAEAGMVDNGKPITREERAELNEMVSKLWVLLKEAEKYKLNTDRYKKILELAKSKPTFFQARRAVNNVGKRLKNELNTFTTKQHKIASDKFHHVRLDLQNVQKAGIDVQQFQDMLDRASTSISLSNYEDAVTILDDCLDGLKTAVDEAEVQGQTAAASGDEQPQKGEPVWDAEEDDSTSSPSETKDLKDELTDKKRLQILEDRFILGEISESTYTELKKKLLERVGRSHQ